MELKIENLSKSYRKVVQALKNVSLDISTGMFGLLTPICRAASGVSIH